MSAQISATGSRSRPQARKKANDDAAYFGPPTTTGAKRHAADKVEGEPRVKRKRADPALAVATSRRDMDPDSRVSLVEFIKMPTPVLYRYLTQFDLVPPVYPSPLLASDPPPPAALDNPLRQPSRAPSPPPATPANRPRRESKEQTRRRSSRLVEEEMSTRPPILADLDELHSVLAGIAERHFRDMASINGREEVDTLASFMCAVEKAKGGKNKF
ncbi:hypothetical protein DFH07DRAFT_211506 [Mycena maculata]|uniref:Histone deacetylase complex subunit SAP30 Sin3 binding domain-containing protein n=1 Tax=Mycena maculata TaxID=230809 RepID=A0AAD7JWJ7_9AGAR|nr:hypothetical protein DFH07DRAFT_211506 [Mycena maculata]